MKLTRVPSVSINIVTFNSARYIRQCLHYVLEQDYPNFEIIVVDNASVDGTPCILHEFENRVRVIYNRENIGFAGGQNQAFELSTGDWMLTLNPDVRLTRDFVSSMVAAGEANPGIGSVSGKLLRMAPDFEIPSTAVLDSTGIYFTPSLRHFDRGSNQPDDGRYDRFEYVFGATGAAALYRRRMIDEISIDGEFFDSNFFAYREDADVAWRAQLMDWKCIYTPNAVAYHVRSVFPQNRGSLPAAINMHSVKNRYLMRIKNASARLCLRHFFPILFRDMVVAAGCLLREWSSLRAFLLVARLLPEALRKRQIILSKRRASDAYLEHWFCSKPVSDPATEVAAIVKSEHLAGRYK